MKPKEINKSERVVVHLRLRPFIEEELKQQDKTDIIDTFDTEKRIAVSNIYTYNNNF